MDSHRSALLLHGLLRIHVLRVAAHVLSGCLRRPQGWHDRQAAERAYRLGYAFPDQPFLHSTCIVRDMHDEVIITFPLLQEYQDS